eukprot:SAG31_NODE_13_length_37961_cov_21.751307_19_plen_129_part_00
METFKKNLEGFAAKHKNKIAKDPEFRAQFSSMCRSIGVDPLQCMCCLRTDCALRFDVESMQICSQRKRVSGRRWVSDWEIFTTSLESNASECACKLSRRMGCAFDWESELEVSTAKALEDVAGADGNR